jgi:broad specificity polyphosphatase/5'/3'-nucleotidase SurE
VVLDGAQPGTDFEVARSGYASVTPVSLDWTNHDALANLRDSR